MIGIILLAAEIANSTSPSGFTAVGIPGEGRAMIEITASPVKLYATPSLQSDVIGLMEVKTPAIVAWRAGFTRTINPGALELRSNTLATAHTFGDITHLSGTESWQSPVKVLFNEGERLPYLFYMGEGTCVVRYQDALMATELCAMLFDPDSPVTLLSQPEYELWFDIAAEQAPAKWLMLEPGVANWLCTEPYDCEENSGT
jgi:hypothetical protein